MHSIFVPHPVILRNLDNEEPILEILDSSKKDRATRTETAQDGKSIYLAPDRPWTMYRWLSRYIIGNKKLGKGDKGSKRAKRLRKAFKDAQPLTWIWIDSEIVDAIKAILEDPEIEWNSAFTCQLTDFEDAWRNALSREDCPEPTEPPRWYIPSEFAIIPDPPL